MIQGPWSDGVPDGWQLRPLWSEFRRGKTLGDGSEELLSVYRDYGVIPKSSRDDNFNKPSEDLSKYQRVSVGDLVVNKMKAWQGSLGISTHDGIVSPAYFVYKATGTFERRFAHYLLRSKEYADHMAAISSGIRPNQWDLDPAQFAVTPLLVPPPAEQRAIADYLDRETAQIDAFIAKNEELITLLTERRASAVTRLVVGLGHADGNRQKVSRTVTTERWEFGPVKRFLRSLDAKRIPLSSEERGERQGEYDYYGASGVIDHVDSYLFDEPLVLVSEDGANLLMRNSPIAFPARGKYWVNNHAHILRPVAGDVDFWADRIEALDLAPVVTGAAQPKLTAEALMNLQVSAPSHEEQRRIADEIRDVKAEIGEGIKIAERGVTLARERRAALISAAVTGKIDVEVAV